MNSIVFLFNPTPMCPVCQMVKSLKLIDTDPLVTATLNKSAIR